jgi:hypothetical protein
VKALVLRMLGIDASHQKRAGGKPCPDKGNGKAGSSRPAEASGTQKGRRTVRKWADLKIRPYRCKRATDARSGAREAAANDWAEAEEAGAEQEQRGWLWRGHVHIEKTKIGSLTEVR